MPIVVGTMMGVGDVRVVRGSGGGRFIYLFIYIHLFYLVYLHL